MTEVKIGNVVEEYKLGNTIVKICDDFYRDKSDEEVQAIISRISVMVSKILSEASVEKWIWEKTVMIKPKLYKDIFRVKNRLIIILIIIFNTHVFIKILYKIKLLKN